MRVSHSAAGTADGAGIFSLRQIITGCEVLQQTLSVQTGIVAHAGGGQGAAVQLTAMKCFIATVATAGDSVKLPTAKVGMEITVINQSATATGPNVFPATGETIQRSRGQYGACSRGHDRHAVLLRDKWILVDQIT